MNTKLHFRDLSSFNMRSSILFMILFGSLLASIEASNIKQLSHEISQSQKVDNSQMVTFSQDTSTFIFQCQNPTYDCSNHGYCSRDNTACLCNDGYVTHDCDASTQCCYKQESRIKMFILSFFVTWTGAPFFILGMTGLGVGILIMCCCGMTFTGIGSALGAQEDRTGFAFVIAVLGFLAFLAAITLSLANWIMFAAETEPWTDRNGIPVGPW